MELSELTKNLRLFSDGGINQEKESSKWPNFERKVGGWV